MLKKTIAPIALAALVLGALPADAARREQSHDKVAALAHDLQRATRHLYRDATRRDHLRSWSHWRAVRAVRQLHAHADRFAERVERYGPGDRRSQREFRELEHALLAARSRAGVLPHSGSLRHEFRKVDRIVERLDNRLAAFSKPARRGRDGRRSDDHYARRGDDHYARRGDDHYARLEWSFRY